jgi:hypothetical protein
LTELPIDDEGLRQTRHILDVNPSYFVYMCGKVYFRIGETYFSIIDKTGQVEYDFLPSIGLSNYVPEK